MEFLARYNAAKYPAGQLLQQCWEKAKSSKPNPILENYPWSLQVTANLCRELASHGTVRFYLSTVSLQNLLNHPHRMSAYRYLAVLQGLDVIELVARGSYAGRKANTYRYLLKDTTDDGQLPGMQS
jgi:hypothetical protein